MPNQNPPLCDKNGHEFYPGDVVRTLHVRDKTHRGKKRYLYYVVCTTSEYPEYLQLIPAQYLNPSHERCGGQVWIMEGNRSSLAEMEIVAGYGPHPLTCFDERKKWQP